MDTSDDVLQFLLANRQIAKKIQSYPGRYFFPMEILPPEIQATVNPEHSGLVLVEKLDESWYILP